MGLTVERRRLHSIRTASLETGRHHAPLRRYLAKAGVIGPEAEGVLDARVLFDADAAATVLAAAAGQLGLGEAGQYLNAPRVQIRILADSGFIVPFVGADRHRYAFTRDELDRFLAALMVNAQGVFEPGEGEVNIPKAAKHANRGAAEVVKLTLDGRLAWVGQMSGTAGYMSVLVRADEVSALTRGPDFNGMPWTALTDELGIAWPAARALVTEGILPSTEVLHRKNRCPVRMVARCDVEAFKRTYVSLMQLAAVRGTHHLRLKKLLEEKSIEPSFPKGRVPTSFYQRTEVADL